MCTTRLNGQVGRLPERISVSKYNSLCPSLYLFRINLCVFILFRITETGSLPTTSALHQVEYRFVFLIPYAGNACCTRIELLHSTHVSFTFVSNPMTGSIVIGGTNLKLRSIRILALHYHNNVRPLLVFYDNFSGQNTVADPTFGQDPSFGHSLKSLVSQQFL